MSPPAPAGTMKACCQPSSVTALSGLPSRAACQPRLKFSWISTYVAWPGPIRIARLSACQVTTRAGLAAVGAVAAVLVLAGAPVLAGALVLAGPDPAAAAVPVAPVVLAAVVAADVRALRGC